MSTKFSQLPAASSLTGTELVPMVQNSGDVVATAAQLGAPITGSVTFGAGGFSGSPTFTGDYIIVGPLVVMLLQSGSATSNANTFTLTGVPSLLQPQGFDVYAPLLAVYDNNTATWYGGEIYIPNRNATWTLMKGGSATGWTASSGKGFAYSFTITYLTLE
jgi:hypothetical protein